MRAMQRLINYVVESETIPTVLASEYLDAGVDHE